MKNIDSIVERLRRDGVTIKQISDELNYREIASSDTRWDDDLCEYDTEELKDIERFWLEAENQDLAEVYRWQAKM